MNDFRNQDSTDVSPSTAILFDGALPPSKKDTRISRLQSYAERVRKYKETAKAPPSLNSQALNALPPPPFLVFAIVEELLQSAYSSKTYVVPGEADPYCVAAAQQNSGDITIFSDDSDLLVYSLGDRTCVAPFRELSNEKTEAGGTTRTGEVYYPARIIQQAPGSLQLENLIKPAFLMSQDPHCTLEKAFKTLQTTTLSDSQPDFKDFSASFQTASEIEEWNLITSSTDRKASLTARDSRVSELIWQSQQLETLQAGIIRVYLPFLIDDPARATSWHVGRSIRALAYAILLQTCEGHEVEVQEYARSGSRVAGTLVERMDSSEVEGDMGKLSAYFDQIFEWAAENGLDETERWKYVALQQTCQHLRENGLPGREEAMALVLNKNSHPRTWSRIHLAAQYQAAFYSLRMLKQLLEYVVDSGKSGLKVLVRLREHLSGLPRIANFFADGTKEINPESWRGVVESLLESLQDGNEDAAEEPRKKRRKKGRARDEKEEQEADEVLARNPFAMLME